MVARIDWEQACLHVLHNTLEVMPFVEIHMNEIRGENPKKAKNEKWTQEEHNRSFQKWLGTHLFNSTEPHSETLMKLSGAPSSMVMRYTSWLANGYTFYTRERDNKHPVQNSGVTIRAEGLHVSSAKDKNAKHGFMNYYGFIEDIWELNYCGLRIPLFKCKWADNKFVKVDKDGITIVDFRRLGYTNDSFILASQAIQVFYVSDPANPQLSLVVHTKSRNFNESSQDDDDNIPPFTKGLPMVEEIDNFDDDVSHLRRLDIDSIRVE